MSSEMPTMNKLVDDKDTLVADLKRIVSDSDSLMQELADSTSEEFVSARRKIDAKLRDARARLHQARSVAADRICSAADATQLYVNENPWKVVGIASLVGLVAALLFYRNDDR